MIQLLDGAPKKMHAYLLGDFQPQSGLDVGAHVFQVQIDRDEPDMAEACLVKR